MPAAPSSWTPITPNTRCTCAGCPGQTYRTQTTYAQPGGLMRWCWSMILLNLLCNCCCGGGWGWRFRM